MKYDVSIEIGGMTRYFQMDIKSLDTDLTNQNLSQECITKADNNSEIHGDNDSSELLNMCLEISRTEYEHSFRRAERLDNKICILLTVCAFIFVVLINAINRISEYNVTTFLSDRFVFAYGIMLLLCIAGTIVLLGALIYSLSGADFKRYDSGLILERNMLSEDMKRVTRFTIMKYESARDCNNKIVTKRYRVVNICVRLLIILVIALISITFLGNFLPENSTVDEQQEGVQEMEEESRNLEENMDSTEGVVTKNWHQ